MATQTAKKIRKTANVRDLFIVGDFIRYFLRLFIPFALLGIIYSIFYECYLMCFLVNPMIYAGGIAAIIIVIKHDINDLMALAGRAREPQLAFHIRHASAIQQIGLQMSTRDHDGALKSVDKLLRQEPEYASALNLKGQILYEGFRDIDGAKACFDKVLKLARPGSEDYRLAQELRAALPGD
ncbi:MAG: hypothetical protein Kow0089_08520 [Desulfobulbaceae bacterium]